MRALTLAAAAALTLGTPIQFVPAQAAILLETSCAVYRDEASSGGVPTRMLEDVGRAAECLMQILYELDGQFTARQISPENLELLEQTTGALLRLFDLVETGGKGAVNQAIEIAREFDGLKTAGVLAYGADLDDTQARMNSSLVLANLVDNSTLCVILDHLADPELSPNGRVNLLGIASLVAPSAVRENFEALSAVADHFIAESAGKGDMRKTASTASNLKVRLEFSSRDESGPGQLDECASYPMRWATGEPYALSYGAEPSPSPAQ